jgi:predicted 2-oxoglutarate/Fe(II)-dependent dioxygenase YbiX
MARERGRAIRDQRLAFARGSGETGAMSDTGTILDRPLLPAIRDDFLDPATHAELLAWTLHNESAFSATIVGDRRVDTDIRKSNNAKGAPFSPWRQRIRAIIAPRIDDLARAVGMEPFPVARIEVDLVCHNDGDFYRSHTDRPVGGGNPHLASRALSMVYYFNAEPCGFTGGLLRIHPMSAASNRFEDVEPRQNRLVAFLPWVLHEVTPISCPSRRFADSRFSINMWARIASPDQS